MTSSITNNGAGVVEETMLAYSIVNPGDQEGRVVQIPKPKPELNFALIRILRAGVCNTDIEILKGYMGFTGVLGHEFVGIVEDVNTENENLKQKWLNVRVCGDINVGCADCCICQNTTCLNDTGCPQMSRNHCPNRSVLGILNRNGTMAQYITLPIVNLHKVSKTISDEVAVFAEPLAAACRISEQNLIYYGDSSSNHSNSTTSQKTSRRRPPDQVCILGDGKLGLMIAEVLGREYTQRHNLPFERRPVLFGKHKHKLDLVQNSANVNCQMIQDVKDSTTFNGISVQHANKYDVVIDATGNADALELCAGLCRPMGTLVLKSTCAHGKPFNAAPFVIDELRVVGSRCGPIEKALRLLEIQDDNSADNNDQTTKIKPLKVEKYITKVFPLSQAAEAIQCASERTTMKVQIICNES